MVWSASGFYYYFCLSNLIQVGPFPFILPLMRLLRLKTAQKWVDADEEIAKVNYDIMTISRCS